MRVVMVRRPKSHNTVVEWRQIDSYRMRNRDYDATIGVAKLPPDMMVQESSGTGGGDVQVVHGK